MAAHAPFDPRKNPCVGQPHSGSAQPNQAQPESAHRLARCAAAGLLLALGGLYSPCLGAAQAGTPAATDSRPEPSEEQRVLGQAPIRESLRRRFHFTVYRATWAEITLPSFPIRVVTLDMPVRKAFFTSAGVGVVLLQDFTLPLGLFSLTGLDLELDGQLLQHSGHQDHLELSGALVLRTGDGLLWDVLAINFAFGEGLSQALADPIYEKGPEGRRGENTVRFQNHLLFELELTPVPLPQVRLVLRLHHRSGIYGLISPQKTGSNYLGAGLRISL